VSDVLTNCEHCGAKIDINKGGVSRFGWGCSECGHWNAGTWAGEGGIEYIIKAPDLGPQVYIHTCAGCSEVYSNHDAASRNCPKCAAPSQSAKEN
jgi:hypothetical protein